MAGSASCLQAAEAVTRTARAARTEQVRAVAVSPGGAHARSRWTLPASRVMTTRRLRRVNEQSFPWLPRDSPRVRRVRLARRLPD